MRSFVDQLEVTVDVGRLGVLLDEGRVSAVAECIAERLVGAQVLHRGDHSFSSSKISSAARCARDLTHGAEARRDHRSALRMGLEHDEPERLVDEGGNESGDGARIEPAQAIGMHAPEEANVLEARRLAAQLVTVGAVAGDQEIGLAVAPERVDQRVHTLQLDEPADEEEVGPTLAWPFDRAGRRRRRRLRKRQEIGKLPHRTVEATAAVLVDRGLAGREKEVDVPQLALEEIRVAPELRRALERERATEAGGLLAELAILLPEVVHRADEPVIVRRVEPDRVAAEAEHPWPEERRQVKVHDVEALAAEDAPQRRRLQARAAGQVRHER